MQTAEAVVHERLRPFVDAGLALNRTLVDMLSDHPAHCTERRGCGFTQATRHLADHINRPRDPGDPGDLAVFAGWKVDPVELCAGRALAAGWVQGWRGLHDAPNDVLAMLADLPVAADLARIDPALQAIARDTTLPDVRLFTGLLRQVVGAGTASASGLPAMPERPTIGSCSQAEEFFLEIAHGRIRRGGRVNIYRDAHGAPVLVEKMDLGESHSALAVAPVWLNGIELPPGSLFALKPDQAGALSGEDARCAVLPLAAIEQARFLRLSTLAVPPADRRRVFSRQFVNQVQLDFLSPASTTIDDLRAFAQRQVAGAR